MTEKEISRFGSICADSSIYQSLSETFSLTNRISDIDTLFKTGKATVGHLKGMRHKVTVQIFKLEDESLIFKATAMGIPTFIKISPQNIEDLAWAYIDLLSNLKTQINYLNILYRNEFCKTKETRHRTSRYGSAGF